MTTLKDADKAFQTGLEDLKTSVFKLKSHADYISAVYNFEKAAKIYFENKDYNNAEKSYLKAIECNKKIMESWAEGVNYLKLAEIYFFNKNNFVKGFEYLREAQVSFKLANKYHTSLKILLDLSLKLQEYAQTTMIKEYTDVAVKVLAEAWEDVLKNIDDEMVRTSIDDVYSKLLDCYLSNESSNLDAAINLTIAYSDVLIKSKPKKTHKIVNAFTKLQILYIIKGSVNKAEDVIDKARSYSDSTTSDSVNDMQALITAFVNKLDKKMNDLISYSFYLFERNLLKLLKKVYDENVNKGSKGEDYLGDEKIEKDNLEDKREEFL